MSSAGVNDRRRLSRTVSRIANASVTDVLDLIGGERESSRRIGITGPPGVGKSTLIAHLAQWRLRRPGNIAILAIDPTSPIGGGAILGDRIRMEELAADPRVYVRSFASRTNRDGLTDNLPSVLNVIADFDFSETIVETAGVGQVECQIQSLVDTTILVVMPGAGDQVQAMKSGISEIADIIVVNKADLPGAQQCRRELVAVVESHKRPTWDWLPPIVLVSAADPNSIAAASAAVDLHQSWLTANDRRQAKRQQRQRYHVASLVQRRVYEAISALPDCVLGQPIAEVYRAVIERITCE